MSSAASRERQPMRNCETSRSSRGTIEPVESVLISAAISSASLSFNPDGFQLEQSKRREFKTFHARFQEHIAHIMVCRDQHRIVNQYLLGLHVGFGTLRGVLLGRRLLH